MAISFTRVGVIFFSTNFLVATPLTISLTTSAPYFLPSKRVKIIDVPNNLSAAAYGTPAAKDNAALASPERSSCAPVTSPTPIVYAAIIPAILAPDAAVIGAPTTAIPAPTALASIIGTMVVAPAPTLKAAQSRKAFSLFSS